MLLAVWLYLVFNCTIGY